MKREIKFRAWCPSLMSMSRSFNLFTHPPLQLTFTGGFGLSQDNLSNKYILMQFTGLKDKNGVDIYEGDVVMYQEGEKPDDESSLAEVSFKFGCWYWEGEHLYDFKGAAVVVSNIHENPELLK